CGGGGGVGGVRGALRTSWVAAWCAVVSVPPLRQAVVVPVNLAFLRAINLGAKRKFPKDAIRAAVEAAGFTDVATHINTGNVRFATTMRARARIEARLEQAFLADRGFEVPTIVFGTAEFARVGADAEELGSDELSRHYVHLMRDELAPDVARRVEALGRDGCRAV